MILYPDKGHGALSISNTDVSSLTEKCCVYDPASNSRSCIDYVGSEDERQYPVLYIDLEKQQGTEFGWVDEKKLVERDYSDFVRNYIGCISVLSLMENKAVPL